MTGDEAVQSLCVPDISYITCYLDPTEKAAYVHNLRVHIQQSDCTIGLIYDLCLHHSWAICWTDISIVISIVATSQVNLVVDVVVNDLKRRKVKPNKLVNLLLWKR